MPMELPRHSSQNSHQHGSGSHTLEEEEGAHCWLGSPRSWGVAWPFVWYFPTNLVGRLFSDSLCAREIGARRYGTRRAAR